VIDEYGADALRLYEMFLGPLEQVKPWSESGVEGVHRFLDRVWRLLIDDAGEVREAVREADPSDEQRRRIHQTIKKVTEDIEELSFNTAIAAMMEFVNAANKWDVVPRSVAERFVLLVSPFAPHLGEELWQRLGHDETLAYANWPRWREDALQTDTVEIAVQVNGDVRGTIEIGRDADEDTALAKARSDDNVARHLDGKDIQREIYVPGRIVNFVAN